jgi:multidrug efflux pump subunit AcrA (membrane-fusion protein)
MSKNYKWIGFFVLALVVIAGTFFGYQKLFTASGQPERSARAGGETARAANKVLVKKGEITKMVSAFGEVSPKEEAMLHFRSNGTLKELRVKEGNKVETGQVLAILSNAQQELGLLQAKNAYEAAKISASPNEIKIRELEYQIAQDSYDNTILKAPFAGQITEINVRENDYIASSGTEILSLMNRDEMFIKVDTDEVDISDIALTQKAQITFEAYPELRVAAEVVSIGYRAVPKGSTKIIQVTLKLSKNDPRIKPGFSAKAQIVVASVKDALLVPPSAVSTQRGKSSVTLVKETGNESVEVKVGLMTDEAVQILSGLQEGDSVLLSNSARSGQRQTGGNTSPFQSFGVPGTPPGGGGR